MYVVCGHNFFKCCSSFSLKKKAVDHGGGHDDYYIVDSHGHAHDHAHGGGGGGGYGYSYEEDLTAPGASAGGGGGGGAGYHQHLGVTGSRGCQMGLVSAQQQKQQHVAVLFSSPDFPLIYRVSLHWCQSSLLAPQCLSTYSSTN